MPVLLSSGLETGATRTTAQSSKFGEFSRLRGAHALRRPNASRVMTTSPVSKGVSRSRTSLFSAGVHCRAAPEGVPQGASTGSSGIAVGGYSPTSIKGWNQMVRALQEAQVKLVTPWEATAAMERGVPVIDIRPPKDYESAHIKGAVSVPFYRPIEGWSPMKILRRVGFAAFGVLDGTEVNPEFAQQVSAVKGPAPGVILYCSLGGNLELRGDTSKGANKGLQSRSIIAAWQLVSSDMSDISVMKGGMKEWSSTGRPVESSA